MLKDSNHRYLVLALAAVSNVNSFALSHALAGVGVAIASTLWIILIHASNVLFLTGTDRLILTLTAINRKAAELSVGAVIASHTVVRAASYANCSDSNVRKLFSADQVWDFTTEATTVLVGVDSCHADNQGGQYSSKHFGGRLLAGVLVGVVRGDVDVHYLNKL